MGYFEKIYRDDLPHRAITVYMYLKDRSDRAGTCWPAISTISRDLGLSRSTVKRALDDLRRLGYLKKDMRFRDNGGRTSNLYTLR